MKESGGATLEVIRPNPFLQAASAIACCSGLYPARLWGISTTSFCSLSQCSATITVKIFLHLMKCSVFHFVPNCLLWCLWASLNGIWLCCLYFPHQVFVHVDKNILSLSFSRLNSPSCLSLSLYVSWSSSWPVAGLTPLCLCLFHNGELRIRPSTEDASYQEWI